MSPPPVPKGAKLINVAQILRDVPELASLEAVAVSGPLEGMAVAIEPDGRWRTTAPTSVDMESVRGDLALKSKSGNVTLRKALPARHEFTGELSGTSVEVVLAAATPAEARTRRSYIRVDENFSAQVTFPALVHDSSTRWTGVARLPLVLNKLTVDLYFLKEGPFLVIESESPVDGDEFRTVGNVVRMLFTLLTGRRLDRPSVHLTLGPAGQLVEARWHAGRQRPDHIYAAIPAAWGEWVRARDTFKLPTTRKALEPEMIATCIDRILDEPRLVTCIEYVNAFPDAPVEMRGALLSVALEAMTDHLEKLGLLETVKPLQDKSAWKQLRSDLVSVLKSRPTQALTKDQLNIFTSRIENLNNPTNKDKLTQPFSVLGVPVTTDELAAINDRNTFLHEGRLIAPEIVAEDPEAWRKAYETEMRLLTCVHKLLLKHLGYLGPVIDWGARGLAADKPLFVLLQPTPAPATSAAPSATPSTQ